MSHPIRKDGELSLFTVLTDQLLDAARNVPDEYWRMTEAEMRSKSNPTPTDYALRVSFWKEFEHAMRRGKTKVSGYSVYRGICSAQYWHNRFLPNQAKVAWILRPMQAYEKELEAILHRATERLWEIIEMPITDSKGRHDPRRAAVILAALKQVEDRVKGMAIQRQQKLQVNVNQPSQTRIAADLTSMDNIDARIKELEGQLSGGSGGAPRALSEDHTGEDVLDVLADDVGEDLDEPMVILQETLAKGSF